MEASRAQARDLTVMAVPFYFGAMAVEYVWLRRRAERQGPSAGQYERRDTVASLAMGVGSLVAPFIVPRLLRPFRLGHGKNGRIVLGLMAGTAVATTVADRVRRPSLAPLGEGDHGGGENGDGGSGEGGGGGDGECGDSDRAGDLATRVAAVGGVATVALAGLAAAATWAERTSPERLWRRRRLLPDLGRGPAAVALAILGWDFIYYWNHRLMHESRHLWAIHVVHHSSERYNLSTALRQPVADTLGTSVPYGLLCLVGLSPELVATARGVNLLYQFWIHTETIGRLGAPEVVLNSPSHHRVHHGSNPPYLDRNHGSILIVWDRLFGTFEPEGETVVYGLTKDIKTFNPGRIATHELAAMAHDVARSDGWAERLSHVVRGPGWGTARASAQASAGPGEVTPGARPSPSSPPPPPPSPSRSPAPGPASRAAV
jgi:sterol desaturase/sphingolipid hydroxylase (fatty acid hydroxylase superfamily)